MGDWLLNRAFMPHGHCFFWSPEVLWLHVASDILTFIAYAMIPVSLVYFVRRRTDLAFRWMFVLFGAFIVCCGTAHLMAVITMWEPYYVLEGIAKGATAIVSIATAVLLIPMIPKALALPSPQDLREARDLLQEEVEERRKVEDEIRRLNYELELRVAERTRELEERNRELSEFVHVVSHDLSAPVRAVSNFSQLLLEETEGQLSGDAREFASYVEDGARRVHTMLRDLVTYARAGQLDLDPSATDLNGLVEDVLADLRPDDEATIDTGELPSVLTSRTAVYRIVSNLVGNALKYGGSSPRIKISGGSVGDEWLLMVRDYGPGIPKEYRKRVFQMFERLHSEDEIPGTGAGLAYSKRLAELLGGDLTLESPPGGGCEFVLRLPQRPEPSRGSE